MSYVIKQKLPTLQEFENSYYEESSEVRPDKPNLRERYKDYEVSDAEYINYLIGSRQGDYYQYEDADKQKIITDAYFQQDPKPEPLTYTEASKEITYMLEYGEQEW